jgi:hypothetical protein
MHRNGMQFLRHWCLPVVILMSHWIGYHEPMFSSMVGISYQFHYFLIVAISNRPLILLWNIRVVEFFGISKTVSYHKVTTYLHHGMSVLFTFVVFCVVLCCSFYLSLFCVVCRMLPVLSLDCSLGFL